MTSIRQVMRRITNQPKNIPPGIYHFQASPEAPIPYRLHLRVESDGKSVLIVNASILLHLNKTATEYVYLMIHQTPKEKVVDTIASRYHTTRTQALIDYQNLLDWINQLIHTPDLDPVEYLGFERNEPFSKSISAPYRLDCAITYRLPASVNPEVAPIRRVDRELDTREWKMILEKAWNAGIPHIVFTGGEPTLREDLPELIQTSEKLGQVSGLLTDGLLFTDTSYLKTILQTGLDHILAIYQQDNEITDKALRNLIASDISVAVHLTLKRDNISSCKEALERLYQMGLKAISLSAVSSELSDFLIELRNRAAELGISMVWDLPVPYSSINPIALDLVQEHVAQGAGKAWLYVEPDGDVLPAQGFYDSVGNILHDPWESVWKKVNLQKNA